MPARTRSTIELRSNSATAPKTVNTIFAAGVEVFICFEKETKSIPNALKRLQSPEKVGDRAGESIESPNRL